MVDLNLKSSRKIVKVRGLPVRPAFTRLAHQAGVIPGIDTSSALSHGINVLVNPPPGASNLQLDFDADYPGPGNVPTNIGINTNVGDLTLVGSGFSYSASGGPNGHGRFTYSGTGYHRGAADLNEPAISTGDFTMAVLTFPTQNNNATIFRSAGGTSNPPFFTVHQTTIPTYQYSLNNNAERLPSTPPTEGTQWDVVIATWTASTERIRLYHAKLGALTITDGGDSAGTHAGLAVGENVNFGGSWAAGDHIGHITRAMVWDGLVGAQDILDYINGNYLDLPTPDHYWTLDDVDTSGSTATDIVGASNGTIVGATTGATGQVGEAYNFSGANDYVDLGNALDPGTGSFSVSCWIKGDSFTGLHRILDNRGTGANGSVQGWFLRVGDSTGDRELRFHIDSGSGSVNFTASTTKLS
jgi:hypothetical protein